MTIINMSGGKAGKPPVYQARTVTPSAFPTNVTPQTGYDALSQVTVNAPANLLAQNIRKDVNIAGITGTYEAIAPTINLQQKTVTPSRTAQTVTPSNGYDGLSQVTVNGDSDLVASNIKSGVNIFGVTGTYTGVTPRASTYDWYPSNAVGSFGYPVLLIGSSMPIPDTGDSYGAFQGFQATGTLIRYTYMSGYFASATGGSCPFLQSAGYYSSTSSMYEIDMSSYSWSNTNRVDGLSSVLRNISGYLGDDYFSGTMKCAVGAYVSNPSNDSLVCSCLMSPSDQDGVSGSFEPDFYVRNVPFTYSNGNVTYTLSTSSTGALGRVPESIWLPGGIQWNTGQYHVRLGLMFMAVTVNA